MVMENDSYLASKQSCLEKKNPRQFDPVGF